jgi:hypothetical protein
MNEKWVEILYFDGVGVRFAYGTISGTLEQEVLAKGPNDWVRLDKVRWLNETGTVMERFEDDLVGTEGFFYLRASTILRAAPIKASATFWEEGKAPLTETIESRENN